MKAPKRMFPNGLKTVNRSATNVAPFEATMTQKESLIRGGEKSSYETKTFFNLDTGQVEEIKVREKRDKPIFQRFSKATMGVRSR